MALSIEWRIGGSHTYLQEMVAKHGEKVFERVNFRYYKSGDKTHVTSAFLASPNISSTWVLCTLTGVMPDEIDADQREAIINLARIRYGS